MFTPPDIKKFDEKYIAEHGGVCGQACLAVITRNEIGFVIDLLKCQGIEFKGWLKWRQLRKFLEARDFEVKQNTTICYDSDKLYIARIQWIGAGEKKEKPFYGYNHWSEAISNTHYVVIEKFKFFCNETGWLDFKDEFNRYLEYNKGVVTSYMEITPKRCYDCGSRHLPGVDCFKYRSDLIEENAKKREKERT